MIEIVYRWPDGREEVRYRREPGTPEAGNLIAQVVALQIRDGKECPYFIRDTRKPKEPPMQPDAQAERVCINDPIADLLFRRASISQDAAVELCAEIRRLCWSPAPPDPPAAGEELPSGRPGVWERIDDDKGRFEIVVRPYTDVVGTHFMGFRGCDPVTGDLKHLPRGGWRQLRVSPDAEREEAIGHYLALLWDTALNGQYPHATSCSADRRHPIGCDGCSCPIGRPRKLLKAAEAQLATVTAKLAEVEGERDAAQKQVGEILKAKATAERLKGDVVHDLAGITNYLSGQRSRLERMGIKLPPRTENHKHEAVTILNAAVEAADGHEYLPNKDYVAMLRRTEASESKIATAESERDTALAANVKYREALTMIDKQIIEVYPHDEISLDKFRGDFLAMNIATIVSAALNESTVQQ